MHFITIAYVLHLIGFSLIPRVIGIQNQEVAVRLVKSEGGNIVVFGKYRNESGKKTVVAQTTCMCKIVVLINFSSKMTNFNLQINTVAGEDGLRGVRIHGDSKFRLCHQNAFRLRL